jgi:hypothetical protein
MNTERAIAFIRRQGSPAEQARLAYLLDGTPPPPSAVDQLLAGQRPDGGWSPFWAAGYSSLDATCYRLAQADQMGIGPTEPAIERALAFLAYRQRADGSWQEEEEVAQAAPPWVKPGDTAATLYLTANCGFWMATLVGSEDGRQAATYLQTFLTVAGQLPTFLHAHWLAGALWHSVGWPDVADSVFTYLHQERLPELSAANLAWLIVALRRAAVPADHPLLQAAATRLDQCQEADGRWPADDGPDWDVNTTLEALRAFHHA